MPEATVMFSSAVTRDRMSIYRGLKGDALHSSVILYNMLSYSTLILKPFDATLQMKEK